MTGVEPAHENPSRLSALAGRSNLMLRVVSSLVLAPIAIAAAYFGGIAFLAFWAIAALAVLWEWDTLICTHDRNPVLATGAVALAGSALLLAMDRWDIAMAIIALGFFGVAALASKTRTGWCASGLVYAAAILIAPVLLRRDANLGFAAILFLFVVVWLTDITAYFVGRAAGGPKLMPRVSPNKTWSGALGGTAAGVAGGVVVASQFGIGGLAAAGAVAFVLSVFSQAGDLAESAIKRQFNAKDASQLIPGHGGLMDRLDGFVAAAAAAALIGIAHGGFNAPGRGLMVW
ncbi:MAG: phosphatidate cytidylyltransferase [Alphaproteobacteria bacterium]|nr:phosphatidate cytidylyltransferase [Alphaproteobacteria bacterium]